MSDVKPDPIVVKQNAVPDIIGVNVRYALTALGGWVTQQGWVSGSQWVTISGAVIAIVPWVYGVILTYLNKKKQVALADAAPNSKAVVT